MSHGFEMYSLEEASLLKEDQNFFEQPPFTEVVAEMLQHPTINSFAKYGAPAWRNNPTDFVRSDILTAASFFSPLISGQESYEEIERHILESSQPHASTKILIGLLRGYPNWYEYVTVKLKGTGLYKDNGEPKVTTKKRISEQGISTYASWLRNRLPFDKGDPKMFGISHLFENNIDRVSNKVRIRWESRKIIH